MSGLVGFRNTPVTIVAGADAPGSKEWTFDNNGNIILPLGGNILNNSGTSVLNAESGTRRTTTELILGTPGVVWRGSGPPISSAKLFVQVECQVTGDPVPHTQSCEIVIASRGGQLDPAMSVYGIVYTSVSPLVTFTIQRSLSTEIEVLGVTTGIVNSNALISVYSIEQQTRYP